MHHQCRALFDCTEYRVIYVAVSCSVGLSVAVSGFVLQCVAAPFASN